MNLNLRIIEIPQHEPEEFVHLFHGQFRYDPGAVGGINQNEPAFAVPQDLKGVLDRDGLTNINPAGRTSVTFYPALSRWENEDVTVANLADNNAILRVGVYGQQPYHHNDGKQSEERDICRFQSECIFHLG